MITGHVGINVRDLDRSTQFYAEAFALDVLARDPKFVFLGRDGALLITLWPQARSDYDGQAAGLHHLSFKVDTVEAVRAAEARLRSHSVRFHHDTMVLHAEGGTSGGIFFYGPDGERLEIFTPAGVEAQALAAPACGFF